MPAGLPSAYSQGRDGVKIGNDLLTVLGEPLACSRPEQREDFEIVCVEMSGPRDE